MAVKPLHPTPKSVRTGQTIYQVGVNWGGPPVMAEVTTISVGSKREPGPAPGEYISVAPAPFLRDILRRMDPWMHLYTFYSKRRARTFCKKLQRSFDNNTPRG